MPPVAVYEQTNMVSAETALLIKTYITLPMFLIGILSVIISADIRRKYGNVSSSCYNEQYYLHNRRKLILYCVQFSPQPLLYSNKNALLNSWFALRISNENNCLGLKITL